MKEKVCDDGGLRGEKRKSVCEKERMALFYEREPEIEKNDTTRHMHYYYYTTNYTNY